MADRLAALIVVALGALWGLYWLPLRELDAVATAGPWATFVVVAVACIGLAPFGWLGRARLAAASNRSLWSIALGGASFVLYSNALLYGHVATVILLFYLTPIWSTLIARFWLGWPIAGWRYVAIGCALFGMALVLGADGGVPAPTTLGDWLGLISGIMWSVASTGIRVHVRTQPAETNFIFCLGGLVMAGLLLVPLAGETPPVLVAEDVTRALGWAVLIGGGWWGVALVALMWASKRLEPARVGILLMTEVIVGALSAALLTDEPFGPLMAMGAVLVIAAGILETLPLRWPFRRRGAGPPR
jgi:drug/metabolite transporter (DMT)-like permease